MGEEEDWRKKDKGVKCGGERRIKGVRVSIERKRGIMRGTERKIEGKLGVQREEK